MSHIIMQNGEVFADLASLELAALALGLERINQSTFKGYSSEVGHGADFIFRVAEPLRSELTKKNYGEAPHEIGVLPDKARPGCFTLALDPFCGGYGLCALVGEPVYDKGQPVCLAPKLKQTYERTTARRAAEAAGDSYADYTLKEASQRYPELFPPSDDEATWVALIETRQRVGV